jgi:gliding motility-associated-like protein
MEIRHVNGYQYRLFLNLYFDEINGLPQYKDNNITVSIFEKGTNKLMMSVSMPLREQKLIQYSIVDCASDELKTSKLLYYQDIYLDPALFTHPQGYYAMWDRCCRNRSVANIAIPQEAGNVYYMEFPAVVKNGALFKNNSPVLPLPLSDYACLGETFSYDFKATDADGDQLVYDLVTPLNGNGSSSNEVPAPMPGPYPEVQWLAGYSKDNAVPATIPLSIDRNTGRLTVRPSQKGLFTFTVRCQEFRNGVKIGEVRRDMVIMVKECTLNRPPVITAREKGKTEMYKPGQVLDIRQSGSRCIDLFMTDPDRDEVLTVTAIPVNFTGDYFHLTGQTSGRINSGSSIETLRASLCFDDCMDTRGQVYLIDVIVSDFGDRGCGQPKQDTIRVSFRSEPMPDRPPTIVFSTPTKVLEAYEGETLQFGITGHDPDNDLVSLSAQGIGFNLTGHNIAFTTDSGQGKTIGSFSWPIDCKAMEREVYQIAFKVTSTRCGQEYTTTEIMEIRPRYKPILNNTVTGGQRLCFGIQPNTIAGSLPTGGNGAYTYTWEVSTLNGIQGFSVAPGENNKQHYFPGYLQQTTWFRRRAMSGACNQQVSEAVVITVDPQPIVRHVPSADICPGENATLHAEAYTSDTELEWYSQPTVGTPLLRGKSFTTPTLQHTTDYYVQATNSRGCQSVTREKVTVRVQQPKADAGEDVSIIDGGSAGLIARGGVRYQWSPAESLSDPTSATPIARPTKTTTYTVTVTTQYGCTDTDEVTVEVVPRIRPANAITLNGDGLNDTWHIENIEHYPKCHIQVFTRWGAKIFESSGYSIPWDGTHDGKQLPMAAYYYIIQLDDKEKPITGSITLIK